MEMEQYCRRCDVVFQGDHCPLCGAKVGSPDVVPYEQVLEEDRQCEPASSPPPLDEDIVDALRRDEWYCRGCDIAFLGREPDGSPGSCPMWRAEAGSPGTVPMWEVMMEDRQRRAALDYDEPTGDYYHVKVYYNRSAKFMRGYEPGDELQFVAELEVPVYTKWVTGDVKLHVCEEVFKELQRGIGNDALLDRLGIRSMSVGDVIEFDDESRYTVEDVGFRKVAVNYTADGKTIVDGFTVIGDGEDDEEDDVDNILFL